MPILYTGGWNNNPTALQFQSTFRRVLARCGATSSVTGNVVQLDDTILVGSSTADNSLPNDDDEDISPFTDDFTAVDVDHDYCSPRLDSLVENVVVYVSGWVVRKVMKQLDCDQCRECLVTTSLPSSLSSSYCLLTLKNNGGLVVPSAGVVHICNTAEKIIRQMIGINKANNTVTTQSMICRVLASLGPGDILNMGEHMIDTQDGIDNHHFRLIRRVIAGYLTIRQHHIAKLHSLQLQGSSVRHKLTKTILFKGQ